MKQKAFFIFFKGLSNAKFNKFYSKGDTTDTEKVRETLWASPGEVRRSIKESPDTTQHRGHKNKNIAKLNIKVNCIKQALEKESNESG